MKMVFDTNLMNLYREEDPNLLSKMVKADAILVPIIVDAELRYGFRYGSKEQENLRRYNYLLAVAKVEIVGIDLKVSDEYVKISAQLRKKGKPIPTNDIWIASIAKQQRAKLLSRDKHFLHIPDLDFELMA